MNNQVYNYFLKHRELISQNLELARKNDNTEAIHNLRLSLKRIKVLLQYIEYISNKVIKAEDELKNIKGLFKKAGRLRDIQVQIQLLQTYEQGLKVKFRKYEKFLTKLESKGQKKYINAYTAFDKNYLDKLEFQIKNILKDIADEIIGEKATLLMKDKLHIIRNIYYKEKNEKSFHKIRTQFKDIIYLNNMVQGKLPVDEVLKINDERLGELGNLLGTWHDKLTALTYLETFNERSGEFNNNEKSQYDILAGKILEDKNREFAHLDHIFQNEIRI
ncbi:MAG: CHAD domain-containing protein [Bacteroidetes bacterium]|nr:CHAD domain-containing protein [Bacteroidota bacterium]